MARIDFTRGFHFWGEDTPSFGLGMLRYTGYGFQGLESSPLFGIFNKVCFWTESL